jgi:chromosome partitioning protein
MTILTITNQKGGVGKTTTVISIAHGLALTGKRVLIIDLDPQGQVAEFLDIQPAPGVFGLLIAEQSHSDVSVNARERLDIIPGDKKTSTAQNIMASDPESYPLEHIAQAIRSARQDYDYILFDTSPSIGGLQERAIWASHYVILPVTTDYPAIQGLGASLKTIDALVRRGWPGKILGILPTKFDQVTSASAEAMTYLKQNFSPILLAPIYQATVLRDCAASGETIFERNPGHRVAQDYQGLVKRVLG